MLCYVMLCYIMFVIKNYITGALLYYGHLCMRGAETICDEELLERDS